MKKNPNHPDNKSQDVKATHISEVPYWNHTMTMKHRAYSNNLVTISK